MFDHFGLLAPYYDRVIGPPDPRRLVQLLRLPVAGRLLDAGGGTGRVSSQLRPFVDELVLSDVSPKMLRQAREKGICCPTAAHAEYLPFPDASFDRVLVVDALHHFCDQREAIGELVRVLKPGGRLVIEEPDLRRLAVKLVAVAEKVALMQSHFYYPHEIREMVAAQGFETSVITDGRFAAWIVADKSGDVAGWQSGKVVRGKSTLPPLGSATLQLCNPATLQPATYRNPKSVIRNA